MPSRDTFVIPVPPKNETCPDGLICHAEFVV
jgi:hypothetical protein